jgi:hypothetical protein
VPTSSLLYSKNKEISLARRIGAKNTSVAMTGLKTSTNVPMEMPIGRPEQYHTEQFIK